MKEMINIELKRGPQEPPLDPNDPNVEDPISPGGRMPSELANVIMGLLTQ